jgi:hypothetical protein
MKFTIIKLRAVAVVVALLGGVALIPAKANPPILLKIIKQLQNWAFRGIFSIPILLSRWARIA